MKLIGISGQTVGEATTMTGGQFNNIDEVNISTSVMKKVVNGDISFISLNCNKGFDDL